MINASAAKTGVSGARVACKDLLFNSSGGETMGV